MGKFERIMTIDEKVKQMDERIEALENQTSVISELEKIKAEIQKYVDENFYSEDLYLAGCGDGAYHTLAIINKRISELKGEEV